MCVHVLFRMGALGFGDPFDAGLKIVNDFVFDVFFEPVGGELLFRS